MTKKEVVHLIGIGGIGMSGLARMYRAQGLDVQGSDIKMSAILADLERLGVKIFVGHDASYADNAGLVIYSSSIKPDHPERLRALEKRIPVIHRAEALARLCEGKSTIAITGTHGKTTTTSLVGMVLREAGRDPSVVVGGLVAAWGGNAYPGLGKEIVIEADESDSSFLRFTPALEVITNIEADHLDHFTDIAAIENAYRAFLGRMPQAGVWFGCSEDARIRAIAGEGIRRSVLYGLDPKTSRIYATDIRLCPQGRRGVSFRVWREGRELGEVGMSLVGRHNVLNALAAVGVGLELNIPFERIVSGLALCEGVGRRFDIKYEDEQLLLVDDYAHHPTEIRATLSAARSLKKKRVFALFQPHRYSRTEALLEDFSQSFSDADKLIVTDIYAASEAPRPGIHGQRLEQAVRASGHHDVTFVPRPELAAQIKAQWRPGDLLITLGAGDISEVASEVAGYLSTRSATRASADLRHGVNGFGGIAGRVLSGEPLSRHTTLRVGGPADHWIEPEDEKGLEQALALTRAQGLPIFVCGAGSNLLPSDEGFRGAVIHLASDYFRKIWMEGPLVVARAGAMNTQFIQFALENGLGGCEFLTGIPGSVGGAVTMNAGSHQQSVGPFVRQVRLIGFDGRRRTLQAGEAGFGYRCSAIRDAVLTEIVFELPRTDRAASVKLLEEYRDYRARTQDLQHASAGCMFKNPAAAGCSSGKLIEDAGLKGRAIGRAQVSQKHANFIINLGGATAQDVRSLIRLVHDTVLEKFNVELETEVKQL